MTTPKEMAEKAFDQLNGTCQSVANLGQEFEDLELNAEFCDRLDELGFCCESCGWWCEQSEMSEKHDDWICIECENDYT